MKDKLLRIRVSEEEYNTISDLSKQEDVSMSDFIRNRLFSNVTMATKTTTKVANKPQVEPQTSAPPSKIYKYNPVFPVYDTKQEIGSIEAARRIISVRSKY